MSVVFGSNSNFNVTLGLLSQLGDHFIFSLPLQRIQIFVVRVAAIPTTIGVTVVVLAFLEVFPVFIASLLIRRTLVTSFVISFLGASHISQRLIQT